jgi:aspartate racemase
MEGRFYPDVLTKRGIAVVVPTETERAYVHDHYLGELVAGVYRPEIRDGVLAIVDRMRSDERIEAVILGGTELPLLFRDGPSPVIPLLDTTGIHVAAAVAKILS